MTRQTAAHHDHGKKCQAHAATLEGEEEEDSEEDEDYAVGMQEALELEKEDEELDGDDRCSVLPLTNRTYTMEQKATILSLVESAESQEEGLRLVRLQRGYEAVSRAHLRAWRMMKPYKQRGRPFMPHLTMLS